MPSSLFSFCPEASYDTLPPTSYLYRWNITTKTFHKLCYKQICTTAHVLGGLQGSFTFQQDCVLQALVSVFQSFSSPYTVSKTNCNISVKFVKAGSKPQKLIKRKLAYYISHQIGNEILTSTKLFIPSFTAAIYLRPDVALCSSSTKTVIILKLICLCKDTMEE